MHRYAAEAGRHAEELLEELERCDEEALRAECLRLGFDGAFDFQRDQRQEILAYLAAMPAARPKRASWRDETRRALLLLWALYYARQAHTLLAAIDSFGLAPGGGYRDTTAAAAAAAAVIEGMYDTPPLWPFGPPSPFHDD
jgi:hypothetical protein